MNTSEIKWRPDNLKLSKLKWPALFIALGAAILFHALVFVFLKDLKIDFSMTEITPFMEKQTSSQPKEMLDQRQEVERQKQLAEVLNQIYLETSPHKLKEDFQEHIPELSISVDKIESTLPVLDDPSHVSESDLLFDHPLPEPLLAETPTVGDEPQSSKFLRRPTDIEILFPKDEYLVDELIMATEMAQGRLAPDEIEDVTITNAIKAGQEKASLDGRSMRNRSGILDKKLAESLVHSGGSFSLSSEQGKWNYSTLRTSTNFQSRDALLPRSNKDELRGFDFKSLGSIAGSNDFNLNVEYATRNEGGFFFRLELVPKDQVKFKHIKQNYFFLIDRSHSIRYSRYEITKTAVAKALALLQKGDTFNILVFDNAIQKLAGENLAWNASNVGLARDFIAKQPYGGLFANTDLYSSLGMIIPSDVAENEINTAILLSDGDTYLNLEKQRHSISTWTQKNAGRVSLFTLAAGKGNNLALLDILSIFNKGSLHYSPTDKGIEGALFNLIQSIRNPIGKDITIATLPSSPDIAITLYPPASYLANLYENTPYVVYGVINQLTDFHIFFQGKYYDKLLDIKQEVSFKKAKKITPEILEKKIAMQKAYIAYYNYLFDGQQNHLNEVKLLLAPYRIPIAFK